MKKKRPKFNTDNRQEADAFQLDKIADGYKTTKHIRPHHNGGKKFQIVYWKEDEVYESYKTIKMNDGLIEYAAHKDTHYVQLYLNKCRQALSKGIPFELSFVQFKNLINNPFCHFTGELLEQMDKSIDRLDNSIGYTEPNSVTCHKVFNRRKSNLTILEIELMYNGVKHLIKE